MKTNKLYSNFKYFVKVSKAYQENGQYFVQGVASGIMEDRDEERMSPEVLKAFVEAIPMPLTDAHPERGPIGGEIGEVIYASILEDENDSLFIKAKLDMDNPMVPYLVKQFDKGKKFAFSIEGTAPVVKTVWSDRLKKMITEYVKVEPKAISITTEPSYIGSFLEVVTKAYNKQLKLNITNTNMKKAKTQTMETTATAAPLEVEKAKTKAVTAAEDIKQGEKEAGQPELDLNDQTTDAESVGDGVEKTHLADPLAQIAAIEAQLAVLKQQMEMEEETESETEEEVEPEVEGEVEPETPGETEPEMQESADSEMEAPVTTEVPTEDLPVKADGDPAGIEAKVDALAEGLKAVMAKLDELVASDKDVHAEIGKSKKETGMLIKSFYDEITSLPLQKRSLVKARSAEQIVDEKPKTFKEIAEHII